MAELKLKGMRELSADEIKVMNEIADLGNQFGKLINRIDDATHPSGFEDELNMAPDERWLSIGKTHLQTGIMCLKRAIGKPENF